MRNTTPNPKWLALLKAAALRLQHEGFARNMVRMDSALLQGAMQLLLLVGSAANMALKDSAISTTVPRPPEQKEGVASMAVAARKCARRKAAALLQQLVVSAPSMVQMERASLMAVLPVHDLD